MNSEYEIGIVGLGVMGGNLLLNIAEHGYRVIGLDKDSKKVQFIEASKNERAAATEDVQEFFLHLRVPRMVLLLVPAGAAVRTKLEEISPFLSSDDLVIDAGNSHFTDTDYNEKSFANNGMRFLGIGISGGEAGARHGPSIMPGGKLSSYERVRPILEAIAAKVDSTACVAYLGTGSAGHYVKMVHNGIEYALMQLIAESYAIMKCALGLSNTDCYQVFADWNQGELSSYLLEITAQIFKKREGSEALLDLILDVAEQNGTGMWTSQNAMKWQVPVPTIDAAVAARDLSMRKAERVLASTLLPSLQKKNLDKNRCLAELKGAYAASSILIFAQSMALLQKASTEYHYGLDMRTIACIWRGGCIIRAALLDPIMAAYKRNTQLPNLLLDPYFLDQLEKNQNALRAVVQIAAATGIAAPALMTSLAYYDGYRAHWSPANLIQAQRDYFGAHRYQRIDKTGSFHSDWSEPCG